MIDFHSHLLPGLDDGSKNVKESLALLRTLSEQGVRTVVATPHFYANAETVKDFLARRQSAYERLIRELPPDAPRILLGAEVRFYDGIARLEELSSLCIEGSRLLLLEMPMAKWTSYMTQELLQLSCSGEFLLMLAHIERYPILKQKAEIEKLLANDVLLQVNAPFFLDFGQRHRAMTMLRYRQIHALGSDCHNLTDRAPQIGRALQAIRKKCGEAVTEEWLNGMNRFFPSVHEV